MKNVWTNDGMKACDIGEKARPNEHIDSHFIKKTAYTALKQSVDLVQFKKEMAVRYSEQFKFELITYANSAKLTPFIAKLLVACDIDTEFWAGLLAEYKVRNLILLEQLTRVFDAFIDFNVDKAFVYENFGALLASGNDLALFTSGDIDIYVDETQKEQAKSAFHRVGYFDSDSRNNGSMQCAKFYPLDQTNNCHFNVMWCPIHRDKLPFTTNICEKLDWDKKVRYSNTNVFLPQFDVLTYLCLLHVSVHGYARAPGIRLYVDVVSCLQLPLKWVAILKYAQHDNCVVRIATVCAIACRVLGIKIPPELIPLTKRENGYVDKLLSLTCDSVNMLVVNNTSLGRKLVIEAYSDGLPVFVELIRIIFPRRMLIISSNRNDNKSGFKGYLAYLRELV